MSSTIFERLSAASYRVDILQRFDNIEILIDEAAGNRVIGEVEFPSAPLE
jgi:hypothetical protein